MFDTWPLLSLITFLPLLGAVLILVLVGGKNDEGSATTARVLALWVSGFTFVVSLALWFGFDRGTADYQFVDKVAWIPALNISYHMGVDGISVLFVLLSTLLTPAAILASWDAIKTRVRDYMVAFLVLETLMIGTFSALDLFLFYIFFEAVLIPMFLIIGIWGGENRVYASYKFFLYTLLGSILMLIAMLVVYNVGGTSDIPTLHKTLELGSSVQIWLWLAFFASFAVKIPMWPVHTWLPDAHVQAPTAGSVILAGVLLKMGGYGFLRFSLPFFPDASLALSPLVLGLSIVAVVYASLVALVQKDMKKLIAYSSVGHMAFVTAGIWAFNHQGVDGAIFQMLSHGIVSAALFLCVGVVYDRLHTREISAYGGVAETMPHYAIAFMIFMLASVGLPGTSGFIGEFLVLVGLFQTSVFATACLATGLILGATYMLWLYRQVIFGALTSDNVKALLDLELREKIILYPLIVLVFWMGIYPKPILDITSASVANLVQTFQAAVGG